MDHTERQVASTLDGIRADHKARYEWAAERLGGKHVVDAACGVGYGSKILAQAGCTVRSYDRDAEAIEYAEQHYNHDGRITYQVADVYGQEFPQRFVDAVIAFEIIEHLTAPELALRKWREMAPLLLVSVPNEEVFPYRGNIRHHVRHYRRSELDELLALNGYRVREWWGQEDTESEPLPEVHGRTLIAVAERNDEAVPLPRIEPQDDEILESLRLPGRELPKSVAIVALGNSAHHYYRDACRKGGYDGLADEVWAVNMNIGVIRCDRAFHQDDLHIQEARRDRAKDERLDGFDRMLRWLKESDVPVYTSRAYPDYPQAVEYPLEWTLNRLGTYYQNSTVASALCLALAMGVKEISLYGCDFAYPIGDRHKGEKGRACVEFWLGWAAANGITVKLPPGTNLLDRDVHPKVKNYGYDTEWLSFEQIDGRWRVSRVDRAPEDVPTAEDMDRRYSHDSRVDQQVGG